MTGPLRGPRKSRRAIRRTASHFVAVAACLALAGTAFGATWDPIRTVTASGTVATGKALARTLSGTTTYLHAVWRGTYQGIAGMQYARSADDGLTWSKRAALNQSGALLGAPAVATSGLDIHATWALRTGATDTAIYVRRNDGNGNVTSWLAKRRLTPTTAALSEPSIAASGRAVYIAYANLDTAEIHVLVSRDRGVTWLDKTMMTGVSLPELANPQVAAGADNVSVLWLEHGDIAKSRESMDQGRTWTPKPDEEYALGEGLSSADGLGDRIAVVGTGDVGEGFVRVWEDGAWGFANSIPDHTLGANTDADQEDIVVALRGSSEVAVAYAARDPLTMREAIVWVTSANGGATWAIDQEVSPAYVAADPRPVGDPSLVYRSTGDVYILWDQGLAGGDQKVAIRHGE